MKLLDSYGVSVLMQIEIRLSSLFYFSLASSVVLISLQKAIYTRIKRIIS